MTKGELLIACIKACNRLSDEPIDTTETPISQQEEFYDVTLNCVDIINKGYSRLYDANKLPKATKEIKDTDTPTTSYDYFSKYNLASGGGFITDLGKIDNVTIEDRNTGDFTNNVSYRMEGDKTIVLPKLDTDQSYIITYYPKVTRFTILHTSSDDNTTLPYDDEVYDIILNLVKAEMLEEENASLSVYYRNVFEQYLASKDDEPTDVVRRVRNVYGDIW